MRLLSMRQVCELTSLSRASIYRKVEEGKFPKPIELGERKVSKPRNTKQGIKPGQLTGRIAWIYDAVIQWIAERIKQRNS